MLHYARDDGSDKAAVFGAIALPFPMIRSSRYSSKNRQEAVMRIRFLLAAILTAVLAVGPSAAQTPDSLAAARELVTTMRMTDQLKTVLPIIMQSMRPAIVQDRPDVGREYDALLPTMLEIANQRMASYVDDMAAKYGCRSTVRTELGGRIADAHEGRAAQERLRPVSRKATSAHPSCTPASIRPQSPVARRADPVSPGPWP